jgi:hypothetical protein
MPNHLHYGDNLEVLRRLPAESVDLIYLDPPFNSNASYNQLFKAPDGRSSAAQVEAFEDTWHWGDAASAAYEEVRRHRTHSDAAQMIVALRSFLGENDMMAYLVMMAVRLIELHRVLRVLLVIIFAFPCAQAAASPRETAEAFISNIIEMKIQNAIELVAEPDRSAQAPLGRFLTSRPRFPSLWRFEVLFVDQRGPHATVGIAIVHPEIEVSLGTASSQALEELALQQYFSGQLEMTRTEIEVELVEISTGQWAVQTYAEEDSWRRETRYPPEADISAMNQAEILDFRDQLLDLFPHRASEIAALVNPELAILEAKEGLKFFNLSVVDDRTREQRRYSSPAYDIRLTMTNESPHAIVFISGQIVIRNAAREIIDTSPWVFSDQDVPSGLRPGETFSKNFGIKINNLEGEAVDLEIQISSISVR